MTAFLFVTEEKHLKLGINFSPLMSLGWVGEDNRSQCCTTLDDALFSHLLLCFTKVIYYCVQLRNISGDTYSGVLVDVAVFFCEWKQKLSKIISHGVETRVFARAVESCIQFKSFLMFCEMLYFKELCKWVTLRFDCKGRLQFLFESCIVFSMYFTVPEDWIVS